MQSSSQRPRFIACPSARLCPPNPGQHPQTNSHWSRSISFIYSDLRPATETKHQYAWCTHGLGPPLWIQAQVLLTCWPRHKTFPLRDSCSKPTWDLFQMGHPEYLNDWLLKGIPCQWQSIKTGRSVYFKCADPNSGWQGHKQLRKHETTKETL